MSRPLTPFESALSAILENGIEVVPEPYHTIAQRLDGSVQQVLAGIERLRKEGIIRRFRGQINYRQLGRTACLVTASVSPENLDKVNAAVQSLAGVSHQYLRDHPFNLWFTLQASSQEQIVQILAELSENCGTSFYPLPALRMFKLQVRFLADPLPGEKGDEMLCPSRPVALQESQKQVLAFLQREFPIALRPFALCNGVEEAACLQIVCDLMKAGVLKRIAAVLNHYRLGFCVNAMVCACVCEDRIETAGAALASFQQVSHCYQRRTFPGWPYNLFAMVHCRSESELNSWIQEAKRTAGLDEVVILKTLREIKKEPVQLF